MSLVATCMSCAAMSCATTAYRVFEEYYIYRAKVLRARCTSRIAFLASTCIAERPLYPVLTFLYIMKSLVNSLLSFVVLFRLWLFVHAAPPLAQANSASELNLLAPNSSCGVDVPVPKLERARTQSSATLTHLTAQFEKRTRSLPGTRSWHSHAGYILRLHQPTYENRRRRFLLRGLQSPI